MINPITAIEKLINEHGSATVLKERLALAADQFAVLERKLVDADERATRAEIRADDLEAENKALRVDNADLREQIKVQSSRGEGLDEECVKILLFFFEAREASIEDAARSTGIAMPKTDHWAGILRQRDFIRQSKAAMGGGMLSARGLRSRLDSPSLYRITTEGSTYALQHQKG